MPVSNPARPPRGPSRALVRAGVGSFLMAAAACSDLPPTHPAEPVGPTASVDQQVTNPVVPEYVAGQVLVRFRPGAARNEIAEQNRARPREETRLERLWVLEVGEGEEVEIANNLRMNPNVEFAEPNYVYTVVPCETGDCTLPSDPSFGAKWDLHNTGFVTDAVGAVVAQTDRKGADIAWLEAYEYIRNGGAAPGAAVIGIIDTGIRATHQDLAGKVIAGRNFCPSFLCLFGTINAGAWADDNGHGTHVAGIAGAHGNNGLGVPGVGYTNDIRFLAVRVCGGPLGVCNAAGITNGIIWAVDNGAHVLNLSLGGGAASTATQNALRYALDRNVLPVCASGNDGAEVVSFPAAFPECMAVGSTGWGDVRASYSNAGPQVEVVAPGGDLGNAPHSYILAPYYSNNTSYAYLAGTSMATPQVAGLAALLRAVGVNSAAEIRQRIRDTADDLGPAGFDNSYGSGRINVYRAVTGMDPFIHMVMATRSRVNPDANGNMQVVFHGREAETFTLGMVDIASIRLGGTPLAMRPNGTRFAVWSDVDGDGLQDLVLHFSIAQLRQNGLSSATTQLALTATLSDGRRLRATAPLDVR
jgi:subtilisin family serine protease